MDSNRNNLHNNTKNGKAPRILFVLWPNFGKQGTDSRFGLKANIESLCPRSSRNSIVKTKNRSKWKQNLIINRACIYNLTKLDARIVSAEFIVPIPTLLELCYNPDSALYSTLINTWIPSFFLNTKARSSIHRNSALTLSKMQRPK